MGAMFLVTIVGFVLSLPAAPAPAKGRRLPPDEAWSM
jgi:hypothetical protein